MALYIQHAVASGVGTFPVDMLRYDRACPYTESDSHVIQSTHDDYIAWQVRVIRYVTYKDRKWTIDRWASFGTTLVPDPTLTEKL